MNKLINEKSRAIALIAFSLSLLCWLITIANTFVTNMNEKSGLSILLMLPWYFYLGLLFLGIGFVALAKKSNTFLLIVGISLTVCILFGTYSIIEPNARMGTSFYPAAMVKQILVQHQLSGNSSSTLSNPYQYFVGFQYYTASIVTLTGIDLSIVVKYFHLPLIFLIGLLYAIIARKYIVNKYAVTLLPLLALSASINDQFYFGPQLLAYSLLVLWLFIFIKRTEGATLGLNLLLLLIFAGILFTHILTPFALILFSVIYYLFSLLKKPDIGEERITVYFPLVFVVAYTLYLEYLAYAIFKTSIFNVFRSLSSPDVFISSFLSGRQALPTAEIPVKLTNYFSHVFFYIIALLLPILFTTYFWIRSTISKKKFNYTFVLLSIWLVSQLFMGFTVYGGEIIGRIYLFSLPAAIILTTIFFKNRSYYLIILLFFMLFLHPLAYVGDESYKMTPDSELVGAQFYATHATDEPYFIQVGAQYIWYYAPTRGFESFYTLGMPPYSDFNEKVELTYIIRNTVGKNGFLFHLGYDVLDKHTEYINANYNFVYSNGNYQIYRKIK